MPGEMTASTVKTGLDSLSSTISSNQGEAAGVKAQLADLISRLDAIPSANSDLIAAINGYTPTGAFETLAQDELAKLTSEFSALKSAVQSAHDAL